MKLRVKKLWARRVVQAGSVYNPRD